MADALAKERGEASKALDKAEALKPGRGRVDLFGFARRDAHGGVVGAGVDYLHRINESLSAFARGEVGATLPDPETYAKAILGMRVTF